MSGAADVDPAAKPSLRLWAGLAASVVAVAAIGYGATGSPTRADRDASAALRGDASSDPFSASAGASTSASTNPSTSVSTNDAVVVATLERMAQRLNDRPDDAAGWALLARARAATGRAAEAVPAFRRAIALRPNDADLLADAADALAAIGDGRLGAEAKPWIARALQLAPDHVKALALSGSAAFDEGDYAGALRQWERVERSAGIDPKMLAEVRASIAQARVRGSIAAPVPAPAPTSAPAR